MSQLVGLAESEMIDKIKFFESFNGSQDGQRAGAGGGGNLQLRESSRSSNTAILLDGVVED
jgi:hypothetical protein